MPLVEIRFRILFASIRVDGFSLGFAIEPPPRSGGYIPLRVTDVKRGV